MRASTHSERLAATIATVVIALTLLVPCAASAQVKVILSGGFSAAYCDLLPEFERTSGVTVTTSRGGSQGNGPNTVRVQLRRGVRADVVIMNRVGLRDLIAEGRTITGTDVDLAQTPLGVAIRAGTTKPDISTVETFKQSLLRAKSVTFDSSSSGIYLTTILFPRLGIAAELAAKSSSVGVTAVATGDAEIAVQPVSEILPVQGVDFIGTIPPEVQYIAVFSAAVVTGSTEVEAAKRLIAFLSSEHATAAMRKNGMEPPTRR